MAIMEKYVTVKFGPNLAVSMGNACLYQQVNRDILTGLIKRFHSLSQTHYLSCFATLGHNL